MTKVQHTPGPWDFRGPQSNFDKGKYYIERTNPDSGNREAVAYTSKAYNGTTTIKNARLIAAAPELLLQLNATHNMLAMLWEFETNEERRKIIADQLDINTHLLAKARGQA